MFRKVNNKKLSVVFIVLLVIVVILVILDNRKGGRSFTENLVSVDTADIARIEISTGDKNEKVILLEKVDNSWKVSKSGKTYETNKMQINDILGRLANMKPSGVVSDNKDKLLIITLLIQQAYMFGFLTKKRKKPISLSEGLITSQITIICMVINMAVICQVLLKHM